MLAGCYGYEADRYIRGRHVGACDGSECSGCQPCPERHCENCGKSHVGVFEQTCPTCIGKVRKHLGDLVDLYALLPTEAEHKAYRQGADSEAVHLLGPAANPEAWSWRKISAMVQVTRPDGTVGPRKDHVSLTEDDDEQHPLEVLGRWVFMLGEDYGEPTDLELTITRAVDYLERRLGRLANDTGQDWKLFAGEVRRCKAHLEAVLHEGEQRDTGAPCMTCETPLKRVWGLQERFDGWMCPRCRETSSEAQYRIAVAHLHRIEASHLTDHDMEIRTGVKAGTVRAWARRGHVARRRDSGRTLYSVTDVEVRVAGGTVDTNRAG